MKNKSEIELECLSMWCNWKQTMPHIDYPHHHQSGLLLGVLFQSISAITFLVGRSFCKSVVPFPAINTLFSNNTIQNKFSPLYITDFLKGIKESNKCFTMDARNLQACFEDTKLTRSSEKNWEMKNIFVAAWR